MNYVPVPYPDYTPGIIQMKPGEKQLWRVVNACADTQVDLQLQYDGTPQTLQVVGVDGVPTGPRDSKGHGTIVPMTDILLPTAGRAEFIVSAPPATVKNATFLTLYVDTGPIGDNDPQRPLAVIQTVSGGQVGAGSRQELTMPAASGAPGPQRFEGLAEVPPTAQRTLYFSEVTTDERDPGDWLNTQFFITVAGATPQVFSPNNPPAITTTQGSVEDWTIENHTQEVHEFHIHQIHFLLLAINGVTVPADQQQLHDMVQVPYWTGSGPYPSVTVRLDFRGPDIGDFVYHCHILAHEDGGMMAIVRVLPRSSSSAGPYGRLHTLLASIGWPPAKKSSTR
jgi:FtsP/CotA-like multicopper oxidase with cupredoxin domain